MAKLADAATEIPGAIGAVQFRLSCRQMTNAGSNPALIKSLLPSTLNLELIGLGDYPADQHNGKTFLFIEDVCDLAFDARRELINN